MEKQLLKKSVPAPAGSTVAKGVKALQRNVPVGEGAQEIKKMRQPRSRKYLNALAEADTLSANDEKIIEAVQSLPVNNELVGILAPCMLPGCFMHAIDKFGNILDHYNTTLGLSEDFVQGYEMLQKHTGCTSVEVYTATFCIIYPDGIVKFIERESAK